MRASTTAQKNKTAHRGAFDQGIEREASKLARQYSVLLEPDEESGYRGRAVEMPLVAGFGKTVNACVENVWASLTFSIATLLELGQTPPPPAREAKRDEQVNIKLTKHERIFMNEAARQEGYRSVADFMRSLAMRRLR